MVGASKHKPSAIRSQNGIKYRTLCASCNNKVLGLKHDVALKSFLDQVSDMLRTSTSLPYAFNVQGDIPSITRAVLGHLCAVGVNRYDKGPITERLRDFILDETSAPLPTLKLYYWMYPFQGVTLLRDFALVDMPSDSVTVMWMMKLFPIAFAATWEQHPDVSFALPELTSLPQNMPGQKSEIPIFPYDSPASDWPESPTPTSFAMMGQEALRAYALRGSK